MSKWSDPKWIRDELQKKWDSGRILESLLTQDDLFPLTISLKKPKSSEINTGFAEIAAWIRALRDSSKQKTGFGYELKEKAFVNRQSGRNSMPTHAIIPTANDALLLLKKTHDADKFLELTKVIIMQWPGLREWIIKYPLKVIRYSDDWTGILKALRWFYEHPNSGLYMRQMDISGVDTKFTEKRKGIIAELLDNILPETAINHASTSFESRFGLCEKPSRIRFRLLDNKLFMHGLADITTTIEQMKVYSPEVQKVFITENEVNGLCFPDARESIVIFGLGYGVDMLKTVDWLIEKEIYYWGDIDTHGFSMLDQVRSFLPHAKSFLMNEDVLLHNRDMWVIEDKPFSGSLSHLTQDEQNLFCSLQGNKWGDRIRLEQERISYGIVIKEITTLTDNTKP